MQTFRALSALLCYPEQDLFEALHELSSALEADAVLSPPQRNAVTAFIQQLRATPLLDAQESYVALFDRHRSLSLHLYEHVHGESRERGQAMVRLASLYRLHGLEIGTNELPDYLPLYLEFLSQLPERTARSMLAEAVHVVAALARKLESRRSPYAAVMRAVEVLAARPPEAAAIEEVSGKLNAEADSLIALDRQWEDEAVRFTAAGASHDSGGMTP